MRKFVTITILFLCCSCDPGQTLIITNYGRPKTSVGIYMDKAGLSSRWEEKDRGPIVIYVPTDSIKSDTVRKSYAIGAWWEQEMDTLNHYIDSIVLKSEFSTCILRDSSEIRNYIKDHRGGYLKSVLTIGPEDTLTMKDIIGEWIMDNRDSSFYLDDTLIFMKKNKPKIPFNNSYKLSAEDEYARKNYQYSVDLTLYKKSYAVFSQIYRPENYDRRGDIINDLDLECKWAMVHNVLTIRLDKINVTCRLLYIGRRNGSFLVDGVKYETDYFTFVRLGN